MTVNTRLRENPKLQQMPKNERDWVQYQNEMAKWVIRVAKLGDGSMTTSGGTTIDGLGEMPGIVPSEQSLPMVVTGNAKSIQDDATPLTAADAGTSVTITIAAHGLQTSTGLVSYNAGTITGLSYATTYYVYASDPTYAGGAVTYLATTDRTDLVSAVGLYYVGNIVTGNQNASGNISGITKGNPTTFITSAAHGFSTGYTVEIDNIVDDGPGGDIESTFNGNEYEVTVTSTTQFTVGVNSSALVNVWASGGSATYVGTFPPGGSGGGGGYIP
jgi:hypothetical protein